MKKKMFSALLAVAMFCAMMVPASAAHSVAETKEYMNELRDSNNPADHIAQDTNKQLTATTSKD